MARETFVRRTELAFSQPANRALHRNALPNRFVRVTRAPATLGKDQVQVMTTPLSAVAELLRVAYDVENLDFPYEPDVARLAVFVEGKVHLSRRRLRYKDASAYTPEELRDHSSWMVRAGRSQIGTVLRQIPGSVGNFAVVALFHGADAKAMRLYRRIAPVVYDTPEDSTTVSAVLVVDILSAGPKEGYEIDATELAPVPGFLRILVFSLGRMFVEHMSTMTMEPGGDA